MKQNKLIGLRWWILGILVVLAVVACSSNKPATPNPSSDGQTVGVQASNQVLVLFDDSVPAASETGGVSLQKATPKLGKFKPRVGLIKDRFYSHPKDEGKSKKHDDDEEDNFESSAVGVSSQAYSYTDAAQMYALMLSNLIGRYNDLTVVRRGISQYKAGDANTFKHTFYIGSTYDNPIPSAFLLDIKNGASVTWINYNFWRYDNATVGTSLSQLGLGWWGITGEYSVNDYTNGFNRIDYRGYTYNKYLAPMEIMRLGVNVPTQVSVFATAKNAAGTTTPYLLKTGNLWFVADNPFTYMHETDRYLVFADAIAPMLGRDVTCTPRSLARMEDLHPNIPAADIKRMLDAIAGVGINFGATIVPIYKNVSVVPNVTLGWGSTTATINSRTQIRRIPNMRGRVIHHGYTHQYETLLNPYGETAQDFEFWRVTLNTDGSWNYVGPVPGLTTSMVQSRLQTGRNILLGLSTFTSNMTPVAWTTPHYASDPSYYPMMNALYSRVWERRLYRVGSLVAGQFFPFPVRDVSGVLVLPENMGSIEPTWTSAKMLEIARANRALRCPWAGHFFHPYILNPAYVSPEALTPAQFQKMLRDIQALGYTYQDPAAVTLQ